MGPRRDQNSVERRGLFLDVTLGLEHGPFARFGAVLSCFHTLGVWGVPKHVLVCRSALGSFDTPRALENKAPQN